MVKIALIQQHASRDRRNNVDRGIEALEEAATHGAELVAYSELAFDRFLPQHPASAATLAHAETIPGPTSTRFCEMAEELGVIVVLNLFEREGDRTFDSSPVINSNGEIVGKTRMIHIIEAPCFHEKGYYTPGNLGVGVFNTRIGKIGVAICYDRHFPEYMRTLALKGAELVVVPQAGAIDEWPPGIFEAELQIAAFQNGYFTALVNRVGEEDALNFAGESYVTDPDGRVIARAPRGQDCTLHAELDFGKLKNSNAKKHFLPDRRPGIYRKLYEIP
jgi:beta-ureidopropionase